jgi:hypothetical protein
MQGCVGFEGALYEGQITPEVSEHLAGCGTCRELAVRLNRLDQAARFEVDVIPAYTAFRKRLILQKLNTVEPEPRYAGALRLARVAIVAVFVFALFLSHHAAQKQTKAPLTSAQTAIDFELVKNGNIVQLRWNGDPHQEYQVYKGPNPSQLAPVQQVKGVAWIDNKPDSSPILFYKIEAL